MRPVWAVVGDKGGIMVDSYEQYMIYSSIRVAATMAKNNSNWRVIKFSIPSHD